MNSGGVSSSASGFEPTVYSIEWGITKGLSAEDVSMMGFPNTILDLLIFVFQRFIMSDTTG